MTKEAEQVFREEFLGNPVAVVEEIVKLRRNLQTAYDLIDSNTKALIQASETISELDKEIRTSPREKALVALEVQQRTASINKKLREMGLGLSLERMNEIIR